MQDHVYLKLTITRLRPPALVVLLCVLQSSPFSPTFAANPMIAIKLSPQQEQRCRDVLNGALVGEDVIACLHAAEALTEAGEGQRVVQALRKRLNTQRDDRWRCGLARELARAGDREQVPVLAKGLASPDVAVQIMAAESLYKIGAVGDETLVRERMKAEDPILQLMAAAVVARHGDQAAMRLIRRHLAGGKPDACKIAAWLVEQIGSADDLPQLGANLAHKNLGDAGARSFTENAIACLGDPNAQAILERNLDQPDTEPRALAAECAGRRGQAALAGKLEKMLDDRQLDVRVRAAQALLRLSGKARPGLSKAA